MGAIAVLGSANMDLVVRQPRRPEAGETIFGTGFETGPGGKGLNQAVAAARAGASVRFLGVVGDDAFGRRLRETLESAGVDTAGLRTTSRATGIASIAVTDDGENTIVVVPGANADEALTDADRAAISASSHLVVQLERPQALVRAAMTFAREHGVTTVLTPAPATAGIDDLVALADILVPNEGEARLLARLDGDGDGDGDGDTDAEASARALSTRAGLAIVTLGSRGALVAQKGEVTARVAARPAAAVDTTGAGDTFVGALVAWLAGGEDLGAALAAATAAAAIAVTRAGAAASAPTHDEIRALLAARP